MPAEYLIVVNGLIELYDRIPWERKEGHIHVHALWQMHLKRIYKVDEIWHVMPQTGAAVFTFYDRTYIKITYININILSDCWVSVKDLSRPKH